MPLRAHAVPSNSLQAKCRKFESLRGANNARTASGWCSLLGRRDGAPAASPPRSTHNVPQLFWFDHLDRPEAAVIATDSGDRIALDPIVMPDATPDWVAHV